MYTIYTKHKCNGGFTLRHFAHAQTNAKCVCLRVPARARACARVRSKLTGSPTGHRHFAINCRSAARARACAGVRARAQLNDSLSQTYTHFGDESSRVLESIDYSLKQFGQDYLCEDTNNFI